MYIVLCYFSMLPEFCSDVTNSVCLIV